MGSKKNIMTMTAALVLTVSLTFAPFTAYASEITDVEAEIAELNKPLQKAEQEYDKALDEINVVRDMSAS